MSKGTVMVVEDNPDALELVQFNLRAAGYQVVTANSGEKALRKASTQPPDLMVLDLMLPGIDGLDLCKMLRRDPQTARLPIIMLTAKATELDRVLGLELGADDYMVKPFSPRELVLRVNRLLRKQNHELESDGNHRLTIGALSIDLPNREITVAGRLVVLTPTEFKLITLLAQRRERVQSRNQLLQEVWGYEGEVTSRTVDTHMRRLRSKLGRAARHLRTVRGFGYRFIE